MKSLSPIVVLFLLVLFRLDVLTREKLAGVLIMSVGMIIACFDEPTFSMWGIALMVVGEAAEAMRMVFFQHLLGQQQFGLIEGLFYTCPANFFFLCIGIAVFEEKSLTEPENYGRVVNNPLPYVVVSCMGFGVILTTLGVIQTCGSLTFKAAGQVRNVGIVFVSIVMFGDVVTAQQACGYAINLIAPSSTAAKRRKSQTIEVEDVSKAFTLFLDVKRSVGFLKSFASEYAYNEMDAEDEMELDLTDAPVRLAENGYELLVTRDDGTRVRIGPRELRRYYKQRPRPDDDRAMVLAARANEEARGMARLGETRAGERGLAAFDASGKFSLPHISIMVKRAQKAARKYERKNMFQGNSSIKKFDLNGQNVKVKPPKACPY